MRYLPYGLIKGWALKKAIIRVSLDFTRINIYIDFNFLVLIELMLFLQNRVFLSFDFVNVFERNKGKTYNNNNNNL